MNLVFSKDENSQVTVRMKIEGKISDFVYVDMIKTLLADGRKSEPEIEGEFAPSETSSINDMVNYINAELEGPGEDEEPKLIR